MQELRAYTTLESAWKVVRARGLNSPKIEIREETKVFDSKASSNLRSISGRLSRGSFSFSPQIGVPKKREKNKPPRPLIVAPIPNRIVQRAILDVLRKKVPAVRSVLDIKTSVGGIEGTDQAIYQVTTAVRNGSKYFIRSDIPGFFTNIPRNEVTQFISDATSDKEFTDLFDDAVTTVLANERSLGENANLFPTGEIGVAQGSALSPLIGNILLRDFDREMNSDGILCVRYIDDFIILAKTKEESRSAFIKAENILKRHGLGVYHPVQHPKKASMGNASKHSIQFLGYQLQKSLLIPSKSSRKKLLDNCADILRDGFKSMSDSKRKEKRCRDGYSQTLRLLDLTIKGWGDAFAYCSKDAQIFSELDKRLNQQIEGFNVATKKLLNGCSWEEKRRILGVSALCDIKHKPLTEKPRKFK